MKKPYQTKPTAQGIRPFSTGLAAISVIIGALSVLDKSFSLWGLLDRTPPGLKFILGVVLILLGSVFLLFTRFMIKNDVLTITDKEVVWAFGHSNTQYIKLDKNKINSLRTEQSLFQRVLDSGDMKFFSAEDEIIPLLSIRGLKNPEEITRLVMERPENTAGTHEEIGSTTSLDSAPWR